MSEQTYTAHYLLNEGEHYTPEIVYPSVEESDGSLPEFRLCDEARVWVATDPEHPWHGTWGEVRAYYATTYPQVRDAFDVEVVYGIWECNPRAIICSIEGLVDKVRRRNLLAADLREQLVGAKAR